MQHNPYGPTPGGPSDPSATTTTGGRAGSWFANLRSGWRGVSGSNPADGTPQYDFGDEASKALEHAGDVRAAVEEREEVPNDPLLDAGVLQALNVKLEGKTVRIGGLYPRV